MGRGPAVRPLTGGGSRARPLAGRRVLVTRSAGQSAGLVERLQARGAEVVLVPMVGFAAPDDPRPLQDALRSLGDGDWLLLTSANAVRAVAGAASSAGAALPPALRLASAGPATTEAIRSLLPGRPITAEATDDFGSEGLARALALVNVAGARMVYPVSDLSPATLARALRDRGAKVEVVIAYRTIPPEGSAERLRGALAGGLDAVTFASPSAVEAFTALGGAGSAVPAIVMGPTTASAARAAGLSVAATAEVATGAGLAEAVERHLAGTPGNR
jgi:uroporphyrinogen-III synthase